MFAAAYVVTAAQQNPFVGRWNLTGTGADNHLIYFLEVKQVGDHLITVRANVTDFGIAVDTEFVITVTSPRRS